MVKSDPQTTIRATFLFLTATAIPSYAQTFTTLATLNLTAGDPNPSAPLVQGSDGNLYGTTSGGENYATGINYGGTVFKLSLNGTLTTVYSFNYGYIYNPAYPVGGVIQGSDGNFYGATPLGGTGLDGSGAVVKVTPGGTATTLCSFPDATGKSIAPQGGLLQASDGNFYGTTPTSQGYDNGTVFRCSPGGALTALAVGNFGTAGRLIQATDGNLYGLTVDGGTNGNGSVFKINQAGTLTTIYSFGSTASDGSSPGPALVQGSDGNLYGVTNGAKPTFFKLTLGGVLTTLHNFVSKTDGGLPNAGLIQGSDGNFYGTAANTSGITTIFRMTPTGTLTTLYTSSQTSGPISNAGLIQASDGKLYGTGTTPSGASTLGIVFSLSLPVALPPGPSITQGGIVPVYSTSTTIQPGEWVSIYGSNLAVASATWAGNFPTSLGGTSVTINGKSAYLWLVSPGQINLQAPNDTATGTVPVVVTTASGTSTSTVTLAQFGPSFSLLDAKHVTGIILRSNGSGAYGGGTYDIIGPTGTSLGYPTVAAKAGDSVVLFGVGFGPTTPAVPAGQVFSGSAATTNPVKLLINNASVTPSFAGLSSAGLYQINLAVPSGIGTGDVPLVGTVGGVQTPTGVVISLQ